TFSLHTEFQSKWYVQVNDSIYETFHEYGITERNSWVPGFNIFSANLSYMWKIRNLRGEISLFVKNILDEQYFGFTEPNDPPDFNSYQPAPGREIFASLKVRF
ncbi:MAG: TonB-dependent receptor, partial [Bacteroidetes bacterium]|nr:TonB-dependent receptor [Bacteroidota bacterium]